MRKVFVFMIAVMLLLGASGCKSVPAAQDVQNKVDAINAYSIALAINAFNALHPSFPKIYNDATLDKAKEACFDLWPDGLTEEEERAAWKLIVIGVWGETDLTPEADKALYGEKIANALALVRGINFYYYSIPHDMLSDNAPLAEVKKALEKDGFWPSYMTDAEADEAWELIKIKNGEAELIPAAWEAPCGEIRYESNEVKIANASAIAEGINVYNALHPNEDPLPGDITLEDAKKALGEEYLWLSFLTDAEAAEAWELIEIKDGVAVLKSGIGVE